MKLSDLKADYKTRLMELLQEKDTIWNVHEVSERLNAEKFEFTPENLTHFLKSRFDYIRRYNKNYYGTPQNVAKAKKIWGIK